MTMTTEEEQLLQQVKLMLMKFPVVLVSRKEFRCSTDQMKSICNAINDLSEEIKQPIGISGFTVDTAKK